MPLAASVSIQACLLALSAASALLAASPARAHPHVWVTTRAEIGYADGRIVRVRHAWTFDKAYSAYVTQGLDRDGAGRLTAGALAGLAAENTANLAEFNYFTSLKLGGREQKFDLPTDAAMTFEDGALTLSFVLPLATPQAQGRAAAALEVYDPTYFVSFGQSQAADAARLEGAPAGCAATVVRPKAQAARPAEAGAPGMTEAFFEALTAASDYGVQFANRVLVACP